jgi:acetyl-CoA decarbonylase/synthase, CODH/ACS complex subunit delta
MAVEIQKEKWTGKVREMTFGATAAEGGTRAKTITVGGEKALPFLNFDGVGAHKPVVAVEIKDCPPPGWSPLLAEVWGQAMADPGDWARAAEAAGADFLVLTLSATLADGSPNTPENARAVVRKVLKASGLPLAVFGPGQADKDNELMVPVAEEGKGERLILGVCEDKNYRTIVAAAMANDHLVNSRTPMDVNLAKQLVILIHDMGMPLERIVMDPTTGALAYGIEYGYSAMERLRLAALQGDSMTQQPMLVTPGEEAWKTKEAKVGEGVPAAWGDWKRRAINWETLTATSLVHAGADFIVVRHPETLARVKAMINDLYQAG